MTTNPTRFRVIQGGGQPKRPRATVKPRAAPRFTIEKFECVPCSAESGHPYGSLVEVRIGAHIIAGRLVGGSLFWACRRCERPHFHIKDFSPTKKLVDLSGVCR